jgi:hypothetical protein
MSYGIDRVNGTSQAGSFFGYQPLFFKVTNGADTVGTGDTGGSGSAIVEGNFTKAIRAIQERASIVILGARTDNGFVVAIDGATANPYLTANDNTDLAAALVAVIEAGTGLSDVAVTAVTLSVNGSGVIS